MKTKKRRIYLFCCSARCTKEAAIAARGWYFLVFGLLLNIRVFSLFLFFFYLSSSLIPSLWLSDSDYFFFLSFTLYTYMLL